MKPIWIVCLLCATGFCKHLYAQQLPDNKPGKAKVGSKPSYNNDKDRFYDLRALFISPNMGYGFSLSPLRNNIYLGISVSLNTPDCDYALHIDNSLVLDTGPSTWSFNNTLGYRFRNYWEISYASDLDIHNGLWRYVPGLGITKGIGENVIAISGFVYCKANNADHSLAGIKLLLRPFEFFNASR